MKSNYQRTADWLRACGKEPGDAEALSIQIACHLEEVAEFFGCLRSSNAGITAAISYVEDMLMETAHYLKTGDAIAIDQPVEALDALCDMEVTGNGIAYLAGWNKEAADQAVLASNNAKLVDGKPVILPSGKIGKPEGWQPPDLSKFV